jgi:hypothetical protein
MKNDIHCYAHYQMRHARAEKLWLPALTDANAIQLAVMLVQRALIDGEISEKMAGLLLYSIQIAAANVGKTTFGQANEEMVTEIRPEDDVMAEHKERMEKLKRIEEAKTVPLIKTEEADLRSGDRVIGASGDRKSNTEARLTADEGGSGKQNLPVINTEGTDPRPGEQTSPRIKTDETDKDGELGKMLPQSVGGEVYANRGEIAEVHANLG